MAIDTKSLSRRATLGLLTGGLVASSLVADAASVPPAGARSRARFGVNAIMLFRDSFAQQPFDPEAILSALGRRGVPFARFAASAHWAGEWDRYEADPRAYWSALDKVFAAAEQHGVGLVPCVFWHTVALALHCNEPMQAWADPASQTRMRARRYAETFVERYDRSPALMMYEFSNELNDWVDLPNVLSFWPKPDETRPSRRAVEEDRLTSRQLKAIVADFAQTIRKHSDKPVSMGSNVPRSNAWHLARGRWDTDSPEQFATQLRAITPPELDVLSIHIYEDKYGRRGSTFATLPDLLQAYVAAAALDGRTTFIGEFGVGRAPDRNDERRRFAAMVEAIGAAGIAYAAIWNYSPARFQPDWDVSHDNDRAYQLDAIVAANRGE